MSDLEQGELPETLKELREMFALNSGRELNANGSKKEDITKKEVILCTVEQLVHNSLISRTSREYMPSLVFHVFNQFPETILEEAMYKLKAKGLLTRLRCQVPRKRALPISTMTFSLSVLYFRIFELPLPVNMFQDAGIILRLIKDGGQHSSSCNQYRQKRNIEANGNESLNMDDDDDDVELKEDINDETDVENGNGVTEDVNEVN